MQFFRSSFVIHHSSFRPLVHRSDRRSVGERQEHHRPGHVRRSRVPAAGLADGSGGDRRTGPAADQRNHPPVHRRRFLFAAELDQALQVLSSGEQFRCDLARALAGDEGGRRGRRAEKTVSSGPSAKTPRASSALRPPPSALGRFRRVHQRGRSERGAGRFGGRCQGHPRGPDRLPLRGRDLPLRRDRVARARLGDRHGHGHLLAEASSATADPA